MNPRERVMLALNHKEPDRIAIDLGGSICSSIHKKPYLELKKYLGMEVEEIIMADYVQQLPYLDEGLLERFGVDFRMVQLPAATAPDLEIFEEGDYWAFIDRWGSKLHMPKDGGLYFDWVEFPIKETSMTALDRYQWPRPDPPGYIDQLQAQAKYLYENTDFALVGSGLIGGGIFEQPARTDPKFADRFMERITEIYIESCNTYLDQIGKYLQVFTYWDDVNSQDGWLISPDIYRKMIKPKQRRLVEAIKKKTDAKLYYHGCGAVFELIPELIEIGFDIINPVQVSAAGMETQVLKKTYGQDIVFWGGGIDTQKTLPFGTPEEVSEEVKQRIDDLAPEGGFVFAPVHNIQAYVPPENIVAAFETALEYGKY